MMNLTYLTRGLLILGIGAISIFAQQKETPKPADQKPISELNKVKMENVSLRYNALQAESAKIQAEASKLVETVCTEAGFKQDECQPDTQAGVVRRIAKAEPAKKAEK